MALAYSAVQWNRQKRIYDLVLVGSVAGHVAAPGSSAYSMSKFAVRALAEAVRGDLAADGIAVTLVSPGFVDSDIRRTNNRGELQSDAPDPIPAWVRVKTEVAVREIIRGVERRRHQCSDFSRCRSRVHRARWVSEITQVVCQRPRRVDETQWSHVTFERTCL